MSASGANVKATALWYAGLLWFPLAPTPPASLEVGMNSVGNRIHVYDLRATILHLRGLDRTQLTDRYTGRDFRLADVTCRAVHDFIAKRYR